MKKDPDAKGPYRPGIGGAAVAMTGGYKGRMIDVHPDGREIHPNEMRAGGAGVVVEPVKPKRPRGLNVIRVAKIDPAKNIAAIIPIPATMKGIKRLLKTSHISMTLVTNIGMVPTNAICGHDVREGKIWRVRGSLPFRGPAILIGFVEGRPSDFQGDMAWLKRMIEFDPEGVDKATNDPRVKPD